MGVIGRELVGNVLWELIVQNPDHGMQVVLEEVIARVTLVENEVLALVAQHPIGLDGQAAMSGGSLYPMFWQMSVRNLEAGGKVSGVCSLMNLGQ